MTNRQEDRDLLKARADLWNRLMTEPTHGGRSKDDIDMQLQDERTRWKRPDIRSPAPKP